MTKVTRNPRRACDQDGNEIPPMVLSNMRSEGVRSVMATCNSIGCGHESIFNADSWPDDMPVPDVALKLRCSECGGRRISTMPDWSESSWHRDYGNGM
jgi:hypothetical protein